MTHRNSRKRTSLRRNSRRPAETHALDRAEDAYERAVRDAEERGADPETDWVCTQRRGAVMEAKLSLRRNSSRLPTGMKSWQGIDSSERRENLIHNRLVGVILDDIGKGTLTRQRAEEYIHEAQAFVDNLASQHPPGGARSQAGKYKARTLDKLRGYLVRARKQLSMTTNAHRRTSRRRTSLRRNSKRETYKQMIDRDSDAYFAKCVAPVLTKKLVADTIRSTGWTPRGKGSLRKGEHKMVDQLLDFKGTPYRSPVSVAYGGSYMMKGDRTANVFINTHGYGTHESRFKLTGSPARDAKQMASDVRDMLKDLESVYTR